MAAVFHTLGAIDHFIRPTGDPAWVYLGTATLSPDMEEEPAYLPVINDLGGRSLPVTYVADRNRCTVTTTLNRFNWTAYDLLRFVLNPGTGAGSYVDRVGDHGTPVMGFQDFQLLLISTFGPTYSSPDTPTGRMYYSAIPRKFRESNLNSRVTELSILFECNGLFNPADRSFSLYTENPQAWGQVTYQ